MAPLDLTLNDLGRSKSRSLTFWIVGDLPAAYYNLNLDVTKESFFGGRGFPLSQRFFLFRYEMSGIEMVGKWGSAVKVVTR